MESRQPRSTTSRSSNLLVQFSPEEDLRRPCSLNHLLEQRVKRGQVGYGFRNRELGPRAKSCVIDDLHRLKHVLSIVKMTLAKNTLQSPSSLDTHLESDPVFVRLEHSKAHVSKRFVLPERW